MSFASLLCNTRSKQPQQAVDGVNALGDVAYVSTLIVGFGVSGDASGVEKCYRHQWSMLTS